MDLLDLIHRSVFLGPEYLTWLWYQSELRDGVFHPGGRYDGGPFELFFDDKLVVSSPAVNAQENFFRGGHPTSSLEARTALRLGKMAGEAKLRVVRGGREWSFVFKAHRMSTAAVKLPAVLSKEDDDKFYERMFLLEQLEAMLDALFAEFLRVRISPEWAAKELLDLRAWVARPLGG